MNNEQEFKVYVVYKDGEQYDCSGMKGVYRQIGSARALITTRAKFNAECNFDKNNKDKDWYDLSKQEQQALIDKEKERYEIRVFTFSGEIVDNK